MKKAAVLLFVLFTGLNGISADVITTVTLTQLAGLYQGAEKEPVLSGLSRGDVSFKSTGNKNVKSELSLKASVGETALFEVDKAYIKTRFPAFRTTIGKTRLAWGDGFFFNTGDVIFGSVNPLADLTEDEVRTESSWLGSVFVPTGRFSFIEGVILPPQIDLALEYWKQTKEQEAGTPENYVPPSPEIGETGAGVRIQGKLREVKTEAGYFYKGQTMEHQPYVSAQGNIYVDWYASAATALSEGPEEDNGFYENLKISWGLYHIAKPSRDVTLNLRLEGLVLPDGRWKEGEDYYSPQTIGQYYGVYLYPEISAGLPGHKSFFIRGVYSPVDTSGLGTVGASWNIYQGFSVLAYATSQFGEDTDQFCFTRYGGYSIAIGAEFIY